jgi:hypothetical protein
MFCGCTDYAVVVLALRPFENASQWIILCCPLSFISQKLFNFFMVCNKKGAVEKNKSARVSTALL